jgi:amino acid transporter
MGNRPKHPTDEFDLREVRRGSHPGDRYVRVAHDPKFTRAAPGRLTVTPRGDEPSGGVARAYDKLKKTLIGKPIPSELEIHERLTKLKALAIFGSDNISSSAYATEEIMRVLLLASVGAIAAYTLPLTLAIIAVLVIVVISYQQTITAYPKGASAYIVSSKELGRLPGLTAAASLLNDYILTVSVSIAAGVAALGAAWQLLFNSLFIDRHKVSIGVALIILMMLINLRGIRESGTIFSAPTYVYILSVFGLVGVGLYKYFTGAPLPYHAPPEWTRELAAEGGSALSLLLILRAFSSGAVGLSGTEAISDGVPAFKPPEYKNARVTLIFMAGTFGLLFLSISFLAGRVGIVPDPEERVTVLSQLTQAIVGNGLFFYIVTLSTALILVLAANTAFSDFPRLSYFLARDNYLPHQFGQRGDRLAFSAGIMVLALIASILYALFGGSVTALVPLYTLGVFTAFTLSQAGMVVHWRRERSSGWKWKAAVNGVGAAITGVVAVVVAITKFAAGAPFAHVAGFELRGGSWMVMLFVPFVILLLRGINHHYSNTNRELAPETPLRPEEIRHTIVVPIAKLNRVALQGLAYARSISPNVTAVNVVENDEERIEMERAFEPYKDLAELVTIESPYRSVVTPILNYIDALYQKYPNDTITVILPEFVAKHWWENLLHNQTALRLKAALLFRRGTVTINVPYHLSG